MGGSVYEWTMEASSNNERVVRGCGSNTSYANEFPASIRQDYTPAYAIDTIFGFRVALYIK